MGHLGVVLYEYLGEEYPEVLGSILGALKAIVNVIGKRELDHSAVAFTMTLVFSVAGNTQVCHVCLCVCRYAQDDPTN